MSEKISLEALSEIIKIEDGVLVWSCKTKGRRKNGEKAGCINKNTGHLCVEIDGKNYKASHLVWLLNNGQHPEYRLEHKNGNKLDNRIENIKEIIPRSTVVDRPLVVSLFKYSDGKLFWARKLSNRSQYSIGDEAGAINKQSSSGYRYIKIGGNRYKAADIVWLYHTGRMPARMLDHINHIKTDDRIENLRETTNKENLKNTPLRKNNTSGVTGVVRRGDKWAARITNNDGERITLGSFKSLESAKEAREIAKKIYGYHENHGE